MTQHNYDGRVIHLDDETYFWGRTDSTTDILRLGEEAEELMLTLPFVAEEHDVRVAIFAWRAAMNRRLF